MAHVDANDSARQGHGQSLARFDRLHFLTGQVDDSHPRISVHSLDYRRQIAQEGCCEKNPQKRRQTFTLRHAP